MSLSIGQLPEGKKIYFASDFHLGVGSKSQSDALEQKVVRWLEEVSKDAHHIFLLGDMFDFWFEYKTVIPKGFIRFQGKLKELVDKGIGITFFTGNHDMWLFNYFPDEFGIKIFRKPQFLLINNKSFLIGHGDGLGPNDFAYKFLKKVFANKLCQWAFARLHPNFGIGIANAWSRKSRVNNLKKEDPFLGEKEWLLQYCREVEGHKHHDYYIFGHRHLRLDLAVGENSRYINLAEWVTNPTYAEFDGSQLNLRGFEN